MREVKRAKFGIVFLLCMSVGLFVGMWIYFDIRNNTPPGTFAISSDAGSPDADGTFVVSWTQANRAENYTLYEYSSFITEINSSLTSLGTTTICSKKLTGRLAGLHYFMVEARNAAGTTPSNCLEVCIGWQAWIWEAGSDAVNANGTYGIKGIPSVTNTPGGRLSGATWVDASGNLWLFGGGGYNESGTSGLLNDMWRFSPSQSQWTWMSGSNWVDQRANFGTKGVPSPTNTPGGRYRSISWAGAGGFLWLLGGDGYDTSGNEGYFNDLWRFDPGSSQWTWVNGSNVKDQPAVYGTKGVPSPSNTPGGIISGLSWVDGAGDLWLFGGNGFNGTGSYGALSDLWRLNMTSLEWAWMGGNGMIDQNGTYGTKSVPSPTNIPGGRDNSVCWASGGNSLWLFGGFGYASAKGIFGDLNDLWQLDTTSLQWTWVSGSNLIDQDGVYGTKGVQDASNIPGGRHGSVSWRDVDGTFWLFGGQGYTTGGSLGYLNDLWCYDPDSSMWTWMTGIADIFEEGTYGTKNVPSLLNTPGGRCYSESWGDAGTGLWIFGGYGIASSTGGLLNSLFRYFPN